MNTKETSILKYLRENPYASQMEIANELNMSRPAVANIISQLIKNGNITGRAYILPENKEIICIGGANVDRKYTLINALQMGTSNPTSSLQSVGGVARNIAENLGRLGHAVRLLSVVGTDMEYEAIEKGSSNWMNLFSIEKLPNHTTGTYSAVLDSNGEMLLALANMDIYEQLTVDYLKKHEAHLTNAQLIIIDMNCSKEVIEYIRTVSIGHNIPLALIPVSSPKMDRMPESLEGIEWLIANKDEAEMYLGMNIEDKDSWKEATRLFVQKGISHVVITWGSEGIMYAGNDMETSYFPAIQVNDVIDVTGAGDAFVSATLYAWLSGEDISNTIQTGMMNASRTIRSSDTVRTELSRNNLTNEMEEFTK